MLIVSTAVKIAVACALPLMACVSYYTVERLGSSNLLVSVAASLALPVLIASVAVAVDRITTVKPANWELWVSAGLAAVSATFLGYVWL